MFSRPRFTYAVALLLLKSIASEAHIVSDAGAELPAGGGQTTMGVAVQLRQLYAPKISPAEASIQEQVQLFYTLVDFTPVWTTDAGPTENAQAALKLLLKAQQCGFRVSDYNADHLRLMLDSLLATPAQPRQRLKVETGLTAALIRFSQHLSHGRIHDSTIRTAQVTATDSINVAIHLN